MSRRRKKDRRRDRPKPQKQHGYDYGFLPRALALGSISFANRLTEADTIALAFGEDFAPSLNRKIPLLALVARKREPLQAAFEELSQWAAATDGDAVDLTILFRSGDEYLLALGPEPNRLRQRCLGFDRVHEALPTFLTWIKPQTAAGPHVRQFQEYCKRLVSPFFLQGASYAGLAVGARPDPSLFRPLDDSCKILKLTATFAEEGDARPGTLSWGLLSTQRDSTQRGARVSAFKGSARDNLLSVSHIVREQALSCHFPVTLERLRNLPATSAICSRIENLGGERWQIEQAFCNVVLSMELVGNIHFLGLSKSALESRIVEAIKDRFEVADGRSASLSAIGEAVVLGQMSLDAGFLAHRAGINPGHKTLPDLLSELRRRNLLRPPDRPT